MGRALLKTNSSYVSQTASAMASMLAVLALSSLPSIASEVESIVPASPDAQLAALTPGDVAQAGNRLGYDVFARLLADSAPGDNLLISPHSLAVALSIVADGADGATAAAFRRVLHQGGLAGDQAAAAHHALQQSLADVGPDATLSIANALWGNRSVAFKSAYIDGARQTYDAEIAAVDFAAPATLDRINGWVSGHTNGMIPTILNQLEPQSTLVVTNAVYFKGLWTKPFAESDTVVRPFRLGVGGKRSTPIMFQEGSFGYYEAPDSQAVLLPYEGGRLSLTIVLPKGQADAAFATAEALEERIEWTRFSDRTGRIGLPRLRLAYDGDVTQLLGRLGLADAFSSQANFTRMSDEQAMLSRVVHRTAMVVDEKGTEAAAATGVVSLAPSAVDVAQPFEMIIDRPFFVALRDEVTGAVLFLGRVAEPGIEQ